jgi:hypothetical protein
MPPQSLVKLSSIGSFELHFLEKVFKRKIYKTEILKQTIYLDIFASL